MDSQENLKSPSQAPKIRLPRPVPLTERYEFRALVGEGGAGEVYSAWDTQLRRTVAVKRIKAGGIGDENVMGTWQEAICLASIRHPNIVSVFDIGVDGDSPYMVMEYIQGETLEKTVKRSPLDEPVFIDIARQCLDGIIAAHHAGLIHRDLKPANLMLIRKPTGFYQVKILDFGIAKYLQQYEPEVEATDGTVLGSVQWISPEQLEAGEVDARSDLYSLGCVFYFALAGIPPFSGGQNSDIISAHLSGASVPLKTQRPDLAEELCDWVMMLISRDPYKRPASAIEALKVLDIITGGLGKSEKTPHLSTSAPVFQDAPTGKIDMETGTLTTSAPAPVGVLPPIKKDKKPILFLVAAVLLLLAFAGFLVLSPKATPPVATVFRVHGSNTIGSKLIPNLMEAFLKSQGATNIARLSGTKPGEMMVDFMPAGEKTTSRVEIHAHGSRTGFSGLANGECDLGMSSSPVREEDVKTLIEKGQGDMHTPACEHVIGLDGLAIITHPGNSLGRLSKDQVADIFSGKISDWAQLGRDKGGPIHIFARDENSGTFESFKSMVLGGRDLASTAKRIEDSGELSQAISIDPDAIGFVGLSFIGNCKAIAIGDEGCPPLFPSPFTVATEDYALARRLFLYSAAEPKNPMVRDFIDFVCSDQGQEIVQKNGFVKQAVEPQRAVVPIEAPQQYKSIAAGAERLSLNFRFRKDRDALDNKAERDLNRLVQTLSQPRFEGRELILIGFTNDSGDADADVKKSIQLAEIVAGQIQWRGVQPSIVTGMGSSMPVAGNQSGAGREKNRRGEVWVTRKTNP
jgi:phosphate transport system substrate-binding protein